MVEDAGVEFAPLRPDVDPNATATIRRVMDAKHGSEVVIRELLVPALRQQYEDIIAVLAGADLVVSHPVTFAVRIAAERTGAPWISTVLSPLSLFSTSDFPVLSGAPPLLQFQRFGPWGGKIVKTIARSSTRAWVRPIDDFRREHGLSPAGHPLFEGQFSPRSTLALFSRVLGQPQPDWPKGTAVTGFVWYNGPNPVLSAELSEFLNRGEPPIVFTLGSSAVGAAGSFYEVSARAAELLGRRAILLVGREPANRPSRLSTEILAVESAPHELLFPRAAVSVHHGGIGTTGQALRAGRPMLVVPFAHDQPDNAHRISKLGVGRVIYPARYTADRVAKELRVLLTSPRYGIAATNAAETVRQEGGAAAACDAIIARTNSG
jgi:UDP:flavonoid glycosyltransferase YjiC (YdhE family)